MIGRITRPPRRRGRLDRDPMRRGGRGRDRDPRGRDPARGGRSPLTAVAAVILAPAGYLFSYHRRGHSNVLLKVFVSVALLAALGQFMASARSATTVDQARIPLASLFLWVQVLHAFDVPRRRDLAFSMVSSMILMAEAGALSLSSSFLVFLVPWMGMGGAWLSLSSRPRSDQVTTPISMHRLMPGAGDRRLAPGDLCPDVGRGRGPGGDNGLPRDAATAGHRSCARRRSRWPGRPRSWRPSTAASRIRLWPIPATASWTSAPVGIRGSATSSTYGRAGSSPTRWCSECARNRPRCGARRCSTPTTASTWTIGDDRTVSLRGHRRRSPAGARSASVSATWPLTDADVRMIQTFYIEVAQPNVLFGASSVDQVYFPAGGLRVDGAGFHQDADPAGRGAHLLRRVAASRPGPALAGAAEGPVPERAVAVPAAADRVARRASEGSLARSPRRRAPRTHSVMAVQAWLQANTRYNLDVPRDPEGVDSVDHFLFETREGYCEQIASSMADPAAHPGRAHHGWSPATARGSATRSPATSR